ncbi:hypothetical protein RchiOBHm_Chr3g0493901 [Rosa chinensis]|uniref:Uncharacterized protein n=1 Tax=Rosa chinensis TaxID=74649 RepID=A0A2P6RGW7_ROSCH|nr:hypothetical protein RchiOBHm_Chr3g0493901 [Rosa chinensis]
MSSGRGDSMDLVSVSLELVDWVLEIWLNADLAKKEMALLISCVECRSTSYWVSDLQVNASLWLLNASIRILELIC